MPALTNFPKFGASPICSVICSQVLKVVVGSTIVITYLNANMKGYVTVLVLVNNMVPSSTYFTQRLMLLEQPLETIRSSNV